MLCCSADYCHSSCLQHNADNLVISPLRTTEEMIKTAISKKKRQKYGRFFFELAGDGALLGPKSSAAQS